jgi:hypothetical protein
MAQVRVGAIIHAQKKNCKNEFFDFLAILKTGLTKI